MALFARVATLATVAGISKAIASLRKAELEVGEVDSPDKCGSIYVSVFSRRDAAPRREDIRAMWHEAGNDFGKMTAEFALCQAPRGEDPSVSAAINAEAKKYGDVRVMDCEEGYLNGILTKKVAASMNVFFKEFRDRDYFMKIDDDTFGSFRRICDLLSWRDSHGIDNSHLYAGVFAEGNENMDTKHPPIRDQDSEWYEPESKFPGEFYPTSAKGGPGYIISAGIVRDIISTGTAAKNILNNEDKAVGVWVDVLVQQGAKISYLNIPGTDGYDEHKQWIVTTGTYGKYPHFLHHHLNGTVISCLHAIDMLHDPAAPVDDCFVPH